MNEEKCQPCRDAHNVHRRACYNPDKNRQYASKYKAKPEAKAKIKAYHKEYHKRKTPSQEVLDARLRKRQERLGEILTKGIDYRLFLADNAQFKKEKKELQGRFDELLAKVHSTTTPTLAIFQNLRKKEKETAKNKEKKTKREKLRQERAVQKKIDRIEKWFKAEEKRIFKETKPIEHGTSLREYERCRKRKEGSCKVCKSYAAGYMREYAKRNPEKVAAWNRAGNNRRYRNAKANGQEFYTTTQVLERWGTKCHICDIEIDLSAPTQCGEKGWEMGLHLDHVIPLSKGGPDTLDNVKPAHGKCNITKGDKIVDKTSTTANITTN